MHLDRDRLDRLVRAHGQAFHLLDLERFESNFRRFLEAFRRGWPRTRLAYSYKTNYTPALCRAVDRLGGDAEVVSEMEYALARRIGVAPECIVFNGPYKPRPVLERALADGATVNLDSEVELRAVEHFAGGHPGRRFRVGLRCNLDTGSPVSRFGFDTDGDALSSALARLARLPGCEVVGLHCHLCGGDRSAAFYGRAAGTMLRLTARHFDDPAGVTVNLGGGFFSPMPDALAAQFPSPIPSYEDYARAVTAAFERSARGGARPGLVLEPGIAIVADAMRFVTRVVECRRVRGRGLAVVAGSVYDVQPTKAGKNLPLAVVPAADGARGDAVEPPLDVVGYTCMEDDVLQAGFDRALAVGDYLVFENVGAYSVVLKPPFIFPAAPILLHAAPERVLRRAESADEIFSTFEDRTR